MNHKKIRSQRVSKRIEGKRARAAVRAVLSGGRPRTVFSDKWNRKPTLPPIEQELP